MVIEKEIDAVAAVKATAKKGIARARKTAGEVVTVTSEVITATREKGEEIIEDTREKTYRAAAETNRLFQEHPVAAVAAAAAAGAVIGIFLPRIAIAGQAGRLAGRALKAAVASEAAQMLVSGLIDTRKKAVRSVTAKAAEGVGKRIRARGAKAEGQTSDSEG